MTCTDDFAVVYRRLGSEGIFQIRGISTECSVSQDEALTLIGDKLERTGDPKARIPLRTGVMFGRTGGPRAVDTMGPR